MRKHVVLFILTFACLSVFGQQGGIRGMVMDADFEVPLSGVKVHVSETEQEVETDEAGNYYLEAVAPGAYTIMFSKSGYSRFIRSEVVVVEAQLTDVDVSLAGEYEEMDELVVRDIQLGGASEIGLLNLRMDSVGMMDSVGADLMSKAGASDAAGALKLVTGATVVDGKYASVRGLSDRYVGTTVNGIRVPSADPKKRAVHMDIFPAGTIESMTVYKNFTPDLPGDYTGGGIDIRTKSIPDEPFLKFSVKGEYNSESTGNDDFVTYKGGGVDFWGAADGDRDMVKGMPTMEEDGLISGEDSSFETLADAANPNDPEHEALDRIVRGVDPVMGIKRDAPGPNWGFGISGGGKMTLGDNWTIGGSAAFTHDDKFYYKNAREQSYSKATLDLPDNSVTNQYKTQTGTEEVKWSALGSAAVQYGDNHEVGVVVLHNQVTSDNAQIKELIPTENDDSITQKQSIYYVERSLDLFQLQGSHKLDELFTPRLGAELDWFWSLNEAEQDEPDVRTFKNYVYDNGDGTYRFQQQADGSSGSASDSTSRAWRNTKDDNGQWGSNLKLPFTIPALDLYGLFTGSGAFADSEGSIKMGWAKDDTDRTYKQHSYYYDMAPQSKPSGEPNANDYINFLPVPPYFAFDEAGYLAAYEGWQGQPNVEAYERARTLGTYTSDEEGALWTDVFTDPDRIGSAEYQNSMLWQLLPKLRDVDYDGEQDIMAYYGMMEFPVTTQLKLIAGARFEKTDISIDPSSDYEEIDPERAFPYIKKNELPSGGYYYSVDATNQAGSRADIEQDDWLPSVGVVYDIIEPLKLRLNYAETIARPTFLELAPVITYDYIEDETFIGNNDLEISTIKNYDVRLEFFPTPGRMFAASVFKKDIDNPIDRETFGYLGEEYIQAVNYPSGEVKGYELEARSSLDFIHEDLEGFAIGVNYTKIDAHVVVPKDLGESLALYGLDSKERDMEGQPEYLFNINATYDNERFGTSLGLFYNLRGEMLKSGASVGADSQGDSIAIPNVYAKSVGILNFSFSQDLFEHWKLTFQAKNLLNPSIEEVYRDKDEDLFKRSYKQGRSYSLGVTTTW
ncbi:TonB-dependent receptor [Pontiella sulfatireligans]|uniref:TonB-dependent receptor n=1 Tax=Pontiella sulfatireligans TaxID=2750658 RepID=A0A6C2UR03_9BACT|nr:TonB-dependent receptor [Pontiella sulfatireligans]VGO21406.1 hypothetical protein SCARR_03479 [Pontiella sulfatireligans]